MPRWPADCNFEGRHEPHDSTEFPAPLRPVTEPPNRETDAAGAAGAARALDAQGTPTSRLPGVPSPVDRARAEVEALSYTVSHDLRSPLGAILNFSALLKEEYSERLGEEGTGWLERIERNARHAVAMMDSLLAYARIGRAVMRPEDVDCAELVRHSLAQHFDDEQRARIELSVDELPRVRVDPELLGRAFVELLRNSLNFTPGTSEVRVTGRRRGERVEIELRDNGPGFMLSDESRPFELFQRFHGSREHGGLGTGLATVRRILEQHDGSVRLETQPGAGTAVIFDVPAASEGFT